MRTRATTTLPALAVTALFTAALMHSCSTVSHAHATRTIGDALSVTVRDRHTRQPVPFAELLVLRQRDVWTRESREHALLMMRDIEDLLRQRGSKRRCDANGQTHVPFDEEGGVLAAVCTDRFGISAYGGGKWEREIEVLVDERSDLRVRVFEPDGSPAADAPVSLRFRPHGQRTLVRTTTDHNGVAVLRDIHEIRRNRAEWNWLFCCKYGLAAERVTVCADTGRGPEVAVDLANPTTESLRLTLPAAGRILVTTREAEGGLARAHVAICPLHPEVASDEVAEEVDFEDQQMRYRRANASGRAIFSHVALGQTLAVGTWSDEHRIPSWKLVIGPRTHGEHVSVDATIGPAEQSISGRVVTGESEQPVADSWLGIYEILENEEWPTGKALTDANGWFRVDIRRREHARRRFVLRTFAPRPLESELVLTAQPRPVIRLRPALPLVTGKVVDATGAPVEGARVRVYSDYEVARSALTDASGAFTLFHGRRGFSDTFQIWTQAPGFRIQSSPELKPGALGVEVRLTERVSRSDVRVRLPGWLSPGRVALRFAYSDDFQSLTLRPIHGHADLLATALDVPSGSCVLEQRVAPHSGRGCLWKLSEVRLEPGDNKLRLNLDTELRELELILVDENGKPVPRMTCELDGNDAVDLSWFELSSADGVYRLPLPNARVRLSVRSEGLWTRPFLAGVGRQRILMRRPLHVRFQVTPKMQLPEGWELRVAANATDSSAPRFRDARPTRADGSLHYGALGDESLDVRVWLRSRALPNGKVVGKARVSVEDVRALQTFSVRIDAAEIKRWLRKYER